MDVCKHALFPSTHLPIYLSTYLPIYLSTYKSINQPISAGSHRDGRPNFHEGKEGRKDGSVRYCTADGSRSLDLDK